NRASKDDGYSAPHQIGCCRRQSIVLAFLRPAIFNLKVPTLDITDFTEALAKCSDELRIGGEAAEKADHWGHYLLRARRERPRRRAAEQSDEVAAPHSITSSAATSRTGGTVSPSALAVLRFIAVSNLVPACTGRLAGLSPRRMRST